MKTDTSCEVLTPAELREALEALSKIEKGRLLQKAKFLAPGTGMEPEDLFQEAVVRSLEQNAGRNCPRDVKLETFLGNVMRSIASHARIKWLRERPRDKDDDVILKAPDPRLMLEEVVIGGLDFRKTIARIEVMFNDDPQAQAVVIGDIEGWSPHEIREMEPMSDKEYAAARKRVRRALLRKFPKGPIDE